MTENNVTAQAGDEPMRAEAILEIWRDCGWASNDGNAIKFARAIIASQVSPRATADVERVPVTPALRRAVDMTRADLCESGSNYPAVRELLAFAESHIATTKPGA